MTTMIMIVIQSLAVADAHTMDGTGRPALAPDGLPARALSGCTRQLINHRGDSKIVYATISEKGTTCLVLNHPGSEGWSLHGQIYAISICPLSPTVVFQTRS